MKTEKQRCQWAISDESIDYHDNEWCVPKYDDATLFEFLILEMMQAGLSWDIILRKRENFRVAFDDFGLKTIAQYDEKKIEELMNNKGIIRNKRKIDAAINNAQKFLAIQKECGSFSNFIWKYVDNKPIINDWVEISEVPASTELSKKISVDLKKLGFRFAGETIIYSFMQACGMVDDHVNSCFKKRSSCLGE